VAEVKLQRAIEDALLRLCDGLGLHHPGVCQTLWDIQDRIERRVDAGEPYNLVFAEETRCLK
jgi:hypothetical protein